MRVLWLAPWFRSFAHIYGGGLALEGHDVQVITSDKHPDPAPAVVEELVCPKSPYDKRWPQAFVAAEQLYRRFRPHVVVAEEFTDPIFALLRRRMRPQWLMIHDASPHDETHELHGLRKFVEATGRRQASHILTFSEYVAREVETAEWIHPSTKVHRVKLLSEVRDEDVPALRPKDERRDFVLMGRLRPYKNVDHVLRAWTAHVNGARYRGDRLIVWSNAWEQGLPVELKEWILELEEELPWNGGKVDIAIAKFEMDTFLVSKGIYVCTPKHHRVPCKCLVPNWASYPSYRMLGHYRNIKLQVCRFSIRLI